MMLLNEKINYSVKRYSVWMTYGLIVIGLQGCANQDVSDLTRYFDEVKARPKGTIQPLPEITVVEPYLFNPEGLRDPFRAVEKVEQEEAMAAVPGSGIAPDTTRRKEELESYPLDTLRMVGTLTMGKGLWGLIKASDGTIHRVKKGNYMGQNYGQIIRILEDKIEMMEIVPDAPGAWREQQAALDLAE